MLSSASRRKGCVCVCVCVWEGGGGGGGVVWVGGIVSDKYCHEEILANFNYVLLVVEAGFLRSVVVFRYFPIYHPPEKLWLGLGLGL